MIKVANDNDDVDYYEEMQYREFAIKVLRFQFMVERRKQLEAYHDHRI